MKKYYIAYVYYAFNGKTMHDNNVFDLQPITFDGFQESMAQIKELLKTIHPEIKSDDQVAILSWQELE